MSKNISFRPLKANEIEVRAVEVNEKKVKLLLYQDARVAQTLLDEQFGQLGWQKRYYESNGILFCDIGVFDDDSGNWVWKSDTGSPSDIEPNKGLASDAFKRAAVSFGIARELYTAPVITVEVQDKDFYKGSLCQRFKVASLTVEEGVITALSIVDKYGNVRYSYPSICESQDCQQKPGPALNNDSAGMQPSRVEVLTNYCNELSNNPNVDKYQLKRFQEWYLGPDKNEPNRKKVETLKANTFMPERLWEKWLERIKNK